MPIWQSNCSAALPICKICCFEDRAPAADHHPLPETSVSSASPALPSPTLKLLSVCCRMPLVILLALDTCDARGSLALLRDNDLLHAVAHEGTSDYSGWVLP